MPHTQRMRSNNYDGKSSTFVQASKLLDEDRCSSRCTSSYPRFGNRLPSSYFRSAISSSSTEPVKEEDRGTSWKCSNNPDGLASTKNIMQGSSDESGSDFDAEVVSGSHAIIHSADWADSTSSSVDEHCNQKADVLDGKAGASVRHTGQDDRPLNWHDRYMPQPPRLYGSMNRSFFVDQGRPTGLLATGPSPRSLRKGSSSKAPQMDDLTAPLLLSKKVRPITDRVFQGETERQASVSVAPLPSLTSKNRNASNFTKRIIQSGANAGEMQNKKKISSQAYHSHRTRQEDSGAGYKEGSSNGAGPTRRSLSNLVCSSAADVLPSVASSTLSNFACSSATDVLPSVPSSLGGASHYFRPRKNSRGLGLLEEGESRGLDPIKRQVEDDGVFGSMDTMDSRNVQSQGQTHRGVNVGGQRSSRSSSFHQRRPGPLKAVSVTHDTSSTSIDTQPLPLNYKRWGRNSSRSGDGPGPFSRSIIPEPNQAFGDQLSTQWSFRRRSLYGSQTEIRGPDNQISSRNVPYARTSASTWSAMRETHYTQSSFSGPPTRAPPLPPLAVFAEPSSAQDALPFLSSSMSPDFSYASRSTSFPLPNQDDEGSTTAMSEAGSFNPSARSASNGETRPRLTVEGLSEILSALEYIERDEDLSYEQILMLEATILLGGIGLHDRYRDMRIDIDNMSYEELLALEERIGNVNTGLSEDSVLKCVRSESFTAPKVNCGYVPQEIEIKCSICQEEFEEAIELGVLECGHSHHLACIKQWLLQKNQCPICKAPAVT